MKKNILEKLRLDSKEAKIEIIFWLILIVSILLIFSKFIFGNQLYMYLDSGLDIVNQYYPYYINEILSIKDGSFSVWNFDYGFGTSIYNANAWTMDIFAILLVLIGLISNVSKIHYLLVWMQILKIIVLYVLTKKYLSIFVKDRISCCFAAYLSTLSGFFFLWGQHFFLGTTCIWIILILIAIEKFLAESSKKNFIYLSLTVSGVLIFSYYIAYMSLITAGLYYLYRYFSLNKEFEAKKVLLDFGKCLYCVFIGILISCIVFVPSCYNLLSTSARLNSSDGGIIYRIGKAFIEPFTTNFFGIVFSRLVSNNIMLSPQNPEYYEQPQLFFTVFIFFFIIQWGIYESKKAKTKKEYYLFIIKILALFFAVFSEIAGLVSNMFVFPIYYRYTFVLIPFFGIIIGTVWEKVIKEKQIDVIGLCISVLITFFALWYSKRVLDPSKMHVLKTIFALTLVGYVLLFTVKYSKKGNRVLTAMFLVIVLASNCYDNYITTNDRWILCKDEYSLKWEKDNLVDDTGKAISWIKENDSSFYKVEEMYTNFSQLGDSFIERVSSALWYNSTMNQGMLDFYKYIYPKADVWDRIKLFKLEDKSDLQAITLANSKYILSKEVLDMEGLKEINKIGEVYIYRNTYTEQIAKFYVKTITSKEFQELSEEEKSTVLYDTLIVEDKIENINSNATAKVKDFNLISQTYVSGKVESTGDGILMIAIPYQEGWEVYVDGEVANQYKVDYGLIGVNLNEGEHNIELKYSVPKLGVGFIFTLIGLANLAYVILKKNGEK